MALLSTTFKPTFTSAPKREETFNRVSDEVCRVIHAAVINSRFRDMLLSNPFKSIEEGFCGEKFHLSHDDKARIGRVRARTLEEFAMQLIQPMEAPIPAELPVYVEKRRP